MRKQENPLVKLTLIEGCEQDTMKPQGLPCPTTRDLAHWHQ